MMPNDALSEVTIYYPWLGLDQNDPTGLEDYEEGGIDLNDVSKGLLYQLWTFKIYNYSGYAESANTGNIKVFDEPNQVPLQEIAGTFDQNMQPFVVYKAADQWHYRWWDTVTSAFVISDLATGVTSCRCTLDDKRQFNSSNSDILLFYTLNDNLYMRRQRDRYNNEILVRAGVGGKLIKVGMNGINRLQFKLVTT